MDELKSGQALSRLLAAHGAQIAAIVLLLLLGLDSALIVTRAFDKPLAAVPPPSGLPRTRPTINPTLQLALIVNAHLFGSAAIASNGDAPQTTMPLILAGVIADKDPNKGQAIIGENATAAKLYAVGGSIPGGARLHAVYADRVLLERNGALEALSLPRNESPAGRGINTAPPLSLGTRLGAAASANPTLLAGLVRVQPVFTQGRLSGYRIFPGGGRGNAAFTQLGLKPGDLIEAVNGTALDDASRAMEVLQTLGSSASATVTVSRNGQSQEVNLNLANLNIEPDLGGAATPPISEAGQSIPPVGPPASPNPRPRRGDAANMGIVPGNPTNTDATIPPPGTIPPGERER
ncbi:MAG TPA: type II secretion system protein GspC [Steroidobacteraceae bacterium]|jgi:general secretion pathway protein C|nr:type II secretion system protein GspC [Steroidobacteraceae bacterium]